MATDPERDSFDDGVLIRMFKQHAPQVRRALIKRTGSAEAADEVLQQAYVQIRESGKLTSVQNEGGYLHTVAINICNRMYREGRRESEYVTFDSELAEKRSEQLSENVDCWLQQEEVVDWLALEAAAARLPRRQRAALALDLQGYTYQEIAQQLGTTAQAVAQLLYCARQKLDTILKATGQGKEKP